MQYAGRLRRQANEHIAVRFAGDCHEDQFGAQWFFPPGVYFNLSFVTDSEVSLDAMVDLVRDNSSSRLGQQLCLGIG